MGCSAVVVNHTRTNTEQSAADAVDPNSQTRSEGYQGNPSTTPSPYHGYYYRILTAQGKDAPGGAYSYLVKGKMIGGFAVVAYPAEYGNSGVMTFIVNHEGKVFQKNLGQNTSITCSMKEYNSDSTWTEVKEGRGSRDGECRGSRDE